MKTCPKCKARKAKRMISQTSFVLKGSGWYSDLYSSSKDDGKKTESAADAPKSSGDDSPKKSDKGKSKSKDKKSSSGGDKSTSRSKAAA